MGVAGSLLVKALDYGLKDPGFQSHLPQRFISLLGALSPTSKIDQKVFLCVFQRVSAIGDFLINWVIPRKTIRKNLKKKAKQN